MISKNFSTPKAFIQTSVDFIKNICHKKSGPVTIALSGGSTPAPIYQALARDRDIPFERIEFFQVDERCVARNQAESNYKLITENLFSVIEKNHVRGLNLLPFQPFDTTLSIPEALKRYEEILQQKVPNGFDIIILGLGPDGHTASLFPHSPVLHEKNRLVAHTTTDQFAVRDRLTITFPLILQSKNILILVKGLEKKSIVEKLTNQSTTVDELPAQVLSKHRHSTIYFGDYN